MIARILFILYIYVYSLQINGQLIFDSTSTLRISSDAIVHTGGGLHNYGTVNIRKNGELKVDGDLKNMNYLANLGTLTLNGSWISNALFNGLDGELQLSGTKPQQILLHTLRIKVFTLNVTDKFEYMTGKIMIDSVLQLENGIFVVGDSAELLLMPGSEQTVGGSSFAYVQGRLTVQSQKRDKFFPLGYDGHYAPIALYDAGDTHIIGSYQSPISGNPFSDKNMLGISGKSLWKIEIVKESSSVNDSAQIYIPFTSQSLDSLIAANNIRHRINTPVVAIAPSPEGTFTSLGASSLTNTDSITYGDIVSELGVNLREKDTFYLAIGRVPLIDPRGIFYIPDIFSPNAKDPDNQSFKVFGENIKNENFIIEIYNKFGSLVFRTTDFVEANQLGWTGINQNNGSEEPNGTYFYYVQLQKKEGQIIEQKGTVYLLR